MKENLEYTILVVDDIPKNIQLVASILTREGYKINFAQNGETALENANQITPALILLDIMMPGMDGFEVCRRLKDSDKTKEIPIIFLTAKTDEQTIAEGFSIGGVDYITKPFNAPELIARVQTHLQLRQREIQLKEINQAKDLLLSIIGHDLKTPLSNIISLGDIIVKSGSDFNEEEKTGILSDMVDSAKLGLNLLENLLAWSRVQLGKITAKLEIRLVESIIKSGIEFVQANADAKEISIISRISSELKARLDLNFTKTVLRNLLSNAVKFTPEKGSIVVAAEKEGESVIISVQDSGVGIPPERMNVLFDSKGGGSTNGTANEKGTGLGLVLSNDLAKMQGGKIEVSSSVGKGSKFMLFVQGE